MRLFRAALPARRSAEVVAAVFCCFHCYAANDHSQGPCAVCGQPVEKPSGLSATDSLIWALGYPDPELAILAARALGRLNAPQSIAALRAAVDTGSDIYLRAEALLSLIAIEGPDARPWLKELGQVRLASARGIAEKTRAESRRSDCRQQDHQSRQAACEQPGAPQPGSPFAPAGATGLPAVAAGPDRWALCSRGHLHWGANGGAGLLLRHLPEQGEPVYLMAERSQRVDEAGTWGIPGGAIHDGESVEAAARREATEEIWPLPPYRVTGVYLQDCGGWQFHIVRADVSRPFAAYAASEAYATGWFTLDQMNGMRMHPGFREWVEENARRGR